MEITKKIKDFNVKEIAERIGRVAWKVGPPALGITLASLGIPDISHAADPIDPRSISVWTADYNYSTAPQSPTLMIEGKPIVTLPTGIYEHVHSYSQVDETTGQIYPYMFYSWGAHNEPAYPGAEVGQLVDGNDSFVMITPDNQIRWYNVPNLIENQSSYIEGVVNGRPIVLIHHRDGSKPEDQLYLIGNEKGEFTRTDVHGSSYAIVGGFENNVLIQHDTTVNVIDLDSGTTAHQIQNIYEATVSPDKKNIVYARNNKIFSIETSNLNGESKKIGDLGANLKIIDKLIVTETGRVVVICSTQSEADYGNDSSIDNTVDTGNHTVLAVIDTDGVTHILATPKGFYSGGYYSLDNTSITFGRSIDTVEGNKQLVNPINFSFDIDPGTGLMKGEVLIGDITLDKSNGSFTVKNWDDRKYDVNVPPQPSNPQWKNDLGQIIQVSTKAGDEMFMVVNPYTDGSKVNLGALVGNGGPSQGEIPQFELLNVKVKPKSQAESQSIFVHPKGQHDSLPANHWKKSTKPLGRPYRQNRI